MHHLVPPTAHLAPGTTVHNIRPFNTSATPLPVVPVDVSHHVEHPLGALRRLPVLARVALDQRGCAVFEPGGRWRGAWRGVGLGGLKTWECELWPDVWQTERGMCLNHAQWHELGASQLSFAGSRLSLALT